MEQVEEAGTPTHMWRQWPLTGAETQEGKRRGQMQANMLNLGGGHLSRLMCVRE